MTWTIKAWQREKGVGVAVSGLGELSFDAAVALVDDFVVGEVVLVNLERTPDGYKITKIWPDDPRISTGDELPNTPILRSDLAQRLEKLLSATPVQLTYRVDSWSTDLIVLGDDDNFIHGESQEIVFRDAGYVDLPWTWEGKSLRLASERERAHVSTKTEVDGDTVVVRIVDDQRVYFVACADVVVRSGRS